MKIAILTLSTLAFLNTTAFAETKPNVPAKEASQILVLIIKLHVDESRELNHTKKI